MPMRTICRICATEFTATAFPVFEMMFGTRERFNYVLCPGCGSLQILELPADLERHYTTNAYYAYSTVFSTGIRERLLRLRDGVYFGQSSILGRFLARQRPAHLMQVLAEAGIQPEMRILDVGAGAGLLLDRLARLGFRRLAGIDPFLPAQMVTPAGVTIRRAALDDVHEPQDVIMFNHSLEHVADPAAELRHAARLLRGGGRCIVRVPTPSSTAWDRYDAYWVQLDAPRHLALPSRAGMARLAARTGFVLEMTIDDSSGFGFWASELYRKGIPMFCHKGHAFDPIMHFGTAQIAEWEAMAAAANAAGRGDQAAFILRRID